MVRKVVRSLIFAMAVAIAVCAPGRAHAASAIGRSKTFGLGIEFTPGTGITAKYFPSSDHALQFGLHGAGYGFRYIDHHGNVFYSSGVVFLHGEYLKTGSNLVHVREFDLPWYVGGGLDVGTGYGEGWLGVHGNLGLSLALTGAPLDFFLEWTPRVWLVHGIDVFPADFNAGIRFWF